MAFFLKKFVAFWLMPLPFCLALIVVGWFLARKAHTRARGRLLVAAGVLLLLFFSNNLVSAWLLRPLERHYPAMPEFHAGELPPAPLAACRYVVVLGGGHADMAELSANNRLSAPSLSRLVEGVRLCRELPHALLIVSGPAVRRNPSHASILARAAVALGVDPGRILLVDSARDTEAESLAVKALVGQAPVALVTSAWHMPRAAADFRAAGVDILPCPADFEARISDDFRPTDLSWDPESLARSSAAVHEFLGNLWMRLKAR